MPSIARRTAILGFSRLAQMSLMFLSPFFLVRVLTLEQYGEYREFLLYGSILFLIADFCINSSLAYFIPREPQRERLYFTQASIFNFGTGALAALSVVLFGEYFPSEIVREHKIALCLYVLFQVNLSAWEVFWIAKKQTIKVLYYSLARLTVRLTAVIGVAYLTRDVNTVILTLVLYEAARLLVMGCFAAKKRLLTTEYDPAAARAQFEYFFPLGISKIILSANLYIGQLFISAVMGPAMLALYVIGMYLNPIVHVLRGSIGDVIMPEIASKTDVEPKIALILWQRTAIVYCVIMLPLAVLLFYYADVFIAVLFTTAYVEAIPIFQIFLLLLVRECFDFSVPLRIVNRTRVFFIASVFTLLTNLGLILILFNFYGILGPAIAMVISRFLAGIVLGVYVMKYCDYTLTELLPWGEIGKVVILSLVCGVMLILGDQLSMNSIQRAVLFGALYCVLYVALLRTLRIPEVSDFLLKVRSRAFSAFGQS